MHHTKVYKIQFYHLQISNSVRQKKIIQIKMVVAVLVLHRERVYLKFLKRGCLP
jgi:hypothetical protein